MNRRILILYGMVILLFSCKEHTKENSKYKDHIVHLENIQQVRDSLNNEFKINSSLNLDSLLPIVKKNITQLDTSNNQSSIIILYTKFKSMVNELNESLPLLKKEVETSTKQIEALIHDLIFENIKQDNAQNYYYEEVLSSQTLKTDLVWYNSKSKLTLLTYDSLIIAIDSLITLHDND